MDNQISPIVLFVYNRPWHIQQTIEALQKNHLANDSELFIFSDGYKSEQDKPNVLEVRDYIHKISGFKSVTIKESSTNKGLANSIIDGVTETVNKFGKVIVLEDDLIISPYFLNYMNEALSFYEHDDDIISISGYMFPLNSKVPEIFFLRGWADCLGWGTWKRGWDLFNQNGLELLNRLLNEKGTGEFDFDNTYPYTEMLRNQVGGKTNSWAIRWYASAFLQNKFTLCVRDSMVKHIGNDDSGTNFGRSDFLDVGITYKSVDVTKAEKDDCKIAKEEIKKYFRENNRSIKKPYSFLRKIGEKLKRLLEKQEYVYCGNFKTWTEAKKYCSGYDSLEILEKCKNSLLKIKNGEAVYERDSVLFDKIEYSWPLLTGLMLAASQNNGCLNVLDFGGSLGSTYFQNRKFLDQLHSLKWNIVEQERFVETGKKYFEDNKLKFYFKASECLASNKPDVLLLSGVLQYLDKPYAVIEQLISYPFKYIIIDRTAFVDNNVDIITIQNVPKAIYEASYPAWFFNLKSFLKIFEGYKVIESFDSYCDAPILLNGRNEACWRGFILKKEKNNA